MPVDIFGHTDVKFSQRTVSGGVTLSQVNNTFLRRDGESAAVGNINLAAHKLINVKDPVDAQDAATKSYADTNKVSKSGDVMTGDLSISVGASLLRTLGCNDLSDSKGFAVLLGSDTNQIQCQLNTPVTLQTTNGFLCRHAGRDVMRLGIDADDPRIHAHTDIVMNQNYIGKLRDPNSAQDAATKNYVDTIAKKCYSGYIPILEANMSSLGFSAKASGASSPVFQPYGAFNNLNAAGANGSWVTPHTTGWLRIKCPEAVNIWRIALKARSGFPGRDITAWNLTASNDNTTFVTLLTSTTALLGAATTPTFFEVTPSEAFRYYRLNITASIGSDDVGVQVFQLYTYST